MVKVAQTDGQSVRPRFAYEHNLMHLLIRLYIFCLNRLCGNLSCFQGCRPRHACALRSPARPSQASEPDAANPSRKLEIYVLQHGLHTCALAT